MIKKACLLMCSLCCSFLMAEQQVHDLVQQLRSADSVAASSEKLAAIANTPEGRTEVISEFSLSLHDTSSLRAWRAEATLVGKLKLVSLASVLASSLDIDTASGTDDGVVTMTKRMNTSNDPAVESLIALGSAAIPSLTSELSSGNRLGRYRASYALVGVGGPLAVKCLQERLKVETDPGLRAAITAQLHQLK